MKGQIARRAMELGGFPVRTRIAGGYEIVWFEEPLPVEPEPPPVNLSRIRLMKTIRRIDPLVAHMIESLAPVYLVKR